MKRFQFIVFLLLIAVSLHYFANTLRATLFLVRGELPTKMTSPSVARSAKTAFARQVKGVRAFWDKLQPKPKMILITYQDNPAEKSPAVAAPGPAVMQITMENKREPIRNTHLGKANSAKLNMWLASRWSANAELTAETGRLFGEQAKKEALFILLDDEKACLDNATSSQTVKEFNPRQSQINRHTITRLNEVFEKYKQEVTRPKGISPEWEAFFRRLDNYRSASLRVP